MVNSSEKYIVQCFNCLGEFDAVEALWCHHDPHNPTKICPYCLNCFCNVPQEYHEKFWAHAPESLKAEHKSFREARQPLGNLLVQCGMITMDQMLHAVGDQARSGEKLGEALVRLGFVTQEELDFFLGLQDYRPPEPLEPQHANQEMLQKLGSMYWYSRRIFPLAKFNVGKKQFALIGCTNRSQTELFEELRDLLLAHPIPVLIDEDAIVKALQAHLAQSSVIKEPPFDASKWVSQLIAGSIARGATDVHMDPTSTELQVRIRIDGVLYKWQSVPKAQQEPIFQRLKQFFKIPETPSPGAGQGVVQLRVHDHQYRVQCVILPGQYETSVTLKIVNLTDFLKDVDALGFLPEQAITLKSVLTSTQGLMVISGPPMHGTITTEYSILRYLQRFDRKIAAIESPVFMRLPEIQQFEPDPAHGRDFRHLLSQIAQLHTDIIYIGSFPGPDVLPMLLDLAAASLVILDFNAMSVWEVLSWMIEQRMATVSLAHRLRILINQRLVRRICENCRHLSSIQRSLLMRMGLTQAEANRITPYEGDGCDQCNYLGYRGRIALFELLEWTPEIGQALQTGSSVEEIKSLAMRMGFKSLREVCLSRIQEGLTTVDEMQRWNIH